MPAASVICLQSSLRSPMSDTFLRRQSYKYTLPRHLLFSRSLRTPSLLQASKIFLCVLSASSPSLIHAFFRFFRLRAVLTRTVPMSPKYRLSNFSAHFTAVNEFYGKAKNSPAIPLCRLSAQWGISRAEKTLLFFCLCTHCPYRTILYHKTLRFVNAEKAFLRKIRAFYSR